MLGQCWAIQQCQQSLEGVATVYPSQSVNYFSGKEKLYEVLGQTVPWLVLLVYVVGGVYGRDTLHQGHYTLPLLYHP